MPAKVYPNRNGESHPWAPKATSSEVGANAPSSEVGAVSSETTEGVTTENGAPSHKADDALLDIFYHSLRDTPDERMREMVTTAWNESERLNGVERSQYRRNLLKVLFHLRAARSGKGEKNVFHTAILTLANFNMKSVMANFSKIPEFGYWKDLLLLLKKAKGENKSYNAADDKSACTCNDRDCMSHRYAWADDRAGDDTELYRLLHSEVVNTFVSQINTDLTRLTTMNSASGTPEEHVLRTERPVGVSLCAKWAPSEGKEFDRELNLVNAISRGLNMTKSRYRQTLTRLRAHLQVVETQMCSKEWSSIQYSRVPSMARLHYTNSFKKHDSERFAKYMADVASGKEKMNVKLIFPHQLVEKYIGPTKPLDSYPDDQSLTVMWNELVKQTREALVKSGASLQGLGVADCSGSMAGVPMQNSVALSLLWAELCEGSFSGHFYTFSTNPRLVKVKGNSLREKCEDIMKYAEVSNTNIQAVFQDLLAKAKQYEVPQKLYPSTIYIFTDGQFDSMVDSGRATNLQAIEAQHTASGYKMPRIVFWNLRGDTIDFPSPGDKTGVAMLSGFSPNLLKLIIDGEELSPKGIMMKAINDPAFDDITYLEE